MLKNIIVLFISVLYVMTAFGETSAVKIDPSIQKYIDAQLEKKGSEVVPSPFEFGGYFRTGTQRIGSGGSKSSGACYSLNLNRNDGAFYRLGNECRDYGEFNFIHKGKKNGIEYKSVFMLDIAGDSRSSTGTESWSRRSRQLYVELKGLFDDNSKLWVGRRYYRAIGDIGDIHVLDGFHVQSSGNGFGLSDVQLGNSVHQFALIGYGGEDDPADATDPEKNVQNYLIDIRSNLKSNQNSYQLAVQKLFVSETADSLADNTSGSTISLQWQRKFDILDNKIIIQRGDGSMSENPGCFGTDGNCFNMSAKSADSAYRLISNGTFDWGSRWVLHYVALMQDSEEFNKWNSIGVRPHYKLGKYWSVLAEISQDNFTTKNNGKPLDEQQLNKYTLAMQASLDAQNFWERPSLRFYISQFVWNSAADTQSANIGLSDSDVKNSTIFGAQAEIWF
ncbi:MAG: hypothetical protein HON90_03120 [Halobacteriovoraceae bacterium]|nr:hypothetical protein [Halobacteriovoraceae bacterium]